MYNTINTRYTIQDVGLSHPETRTCLKSSLVTIASRYSATSSPISLSRHPLETRCRYFIDTWRRPWGLPSSSDLQLTRWPFSALPSSPSTKKARPSSSSHGCSSRTKPATYAASSVTSPPRRPLHPRGSRRAGPPTTPSPTRSLDRIQPGEALGGPSGVLLRHVKTWRAL